MPSTITSFKVSTAPHASSVAYRPLPMLDRIIRRYTAPHWNTKSLQGDDSRCEEHKLDAVIVPAAKFATDPTGVLRLLRPLGRLVIVGSERECRQLAGDLDGQDAQCSILSHFVTDAQEHVLVAEFTPHDLDFTRVDELRTDIRAGCYKMSRYRLYHAIHQATTVHISGEALDLLEIGDSNHVMHDIFRTDERSYTQAKYPPHDLQTLERIDDQSADVFLCDNTLEHLPDPFAGVRQIARVLRPGGWAVLMLPFIAMCQDDDHYRFTPRALALLLRRHFAFGEIGSWGNIDAASAYVRYNKWLRVRSATADTLVCDHQRDPGFGPIHLPNDNDRLHPIHIWAVARTPFEGEPVGDIRVLTGVEDPG